MRVDAQQIDADLVLAALDENIRAAIAARDQYVRARQVTDSEMARLNEQARTGAKRSALNTDQVAERFGVEPSTIRDGAGRHECLKRATYKPGRRLLFPIAAVELHERNLRLRGLCGECDKLARLSLVGKQK